MGWRRRLTRAGRVRSGYNLLVSTATIVGGIGYFELPLSRAIVDFDQTHQVRPVFEDRGFEYPVLLVRGVSFKGLTQLGAFTWAIFETMAQGKWPIERDVLFH